MANEQPEEGPRILPQAIRTLIENTPLLPGEKRKNFMELFLELEYSPDRGPKTSAEYIMIFEATKLIFNLQRLERQRAQLVAHFRPAAVLTLHIRTTRDGIAEPGSLAYSSAHDKARTYFASEEGRKKSVESFSQAGYSPDAVETESYLQAQPLINAIERQIAVAERMLMSFLKELDHRYARRAEEIRRAAARALARGRASTVQNAGAA
jgi:hypothetical protein